MSPEDVRLCGHRRWTVGCQVCSDWAVKNGVAFAQEIAALGATPAPVGQSFALTGGWRVYFNRHGAADRPWCVAPNTGGWEVAVRSVSIATISETVYAPKATPDSEDGKPSAWIAVDGYLTVHLNGHATIGAP